jgi:hypothetical protein
MPAKKKSYAEARLETIATTLGDARKASVAKAATLEKGRERHGAKQTAHESARAAYAADPSEATAEAVHETRDALHLSQIEIDRLEVDAGAANAALATMEAAHADAQRALDDEKREARKAELTERASVASYRAATAPHFASLLEAWEKARISATAIEAERSASNAAALALGQEFGVHLPPLDVVHLLGGILAAVPPERLGAVMNSMNRIRDAFAPGLASVLLSGLAPINRVQGLPTAPADVGRLREELELRLSTRTPAEAEQMKRDRAYVAGNVGEIQRRRLNGEPPPEGAVPRHTVTTPAPLTVTQGERPKSWAVNATTGEEKPLG